MQRIISKNWVRLVLIFIISFSASLTIASFIRSAVFGQDDHSDSVVAEPSPDNSSNLAPAFLDLQATVDAWSDRLPTDSQIGLVIFDLDSSKVAASINPLRTFSVSPLDAFLLSYAGYITIDSATATSSSEDPLLDVSTQADLDSNSYTLGACLDRILQSTDATCIEALRNDPIQSSAVKSLLNDLKLTQTTIDGTESTATDYATLLASIQSQQFIDLDSWAHIQALLQEQSSDSLSPSSPLGVLAQSAFLAKIYTKSTPIANPAASASQVEPTSNPSNYNEAGFIEFPNQNRHYAIVLLSANTPEDQIANLISAIEDYIVAQPSNTNSMEQ